MKVFVETEIIKQIEMVKNFKNNLLLSALKDDGIVDKDEQKIIDKANKLSEKYVKDLKRLWRGRRMSLRDTLTSDKARERYDRNYYSSGETFTMKELEEHDKQIREDAIDEGIKALDEYIEFPMTDEYVIKECIRVLEQLKEQSNE